MPEVFVQDSVLHGQAHVARVVVHVFALVDILGKETLATQAWAAAFLHDIGRKHDHVCENHGQYAVQRLARLPDVQALLQKGGVQPTDWPGIRVAVENHCRDEIPMSDEHWPLTALLKDADALDRVRIGRPKAKYLRFPQTVHLIPFAEALFANTNAVISHGPDYFAQLWPVACRLSEQFIPRNLR